MSREPFAIDGNEIRAGRRATLDIRVARLPTGAWMTMPVRVVHGSKAGPRIWLSAAVHGDELNGVEIVNQVLSNLNARRLAGTVVAVPVVNAFGFTDQSRYLPDGRDLNRSFPGSRRGSLASRLAALFMANVVNGSSFGLDFHTATAHRTNLPQIRADLDDEATLSLARAFGAPVTVHARTRDGSLREAAAASGVPVLLFEGGEAHRFEPEVIAAGVAGTHRVLAELGMVASNGEPPPETQIVRKLSWIRARRAGVFRCQAKVGDRVAAKQVLATIADVAGGRTSRVTARADGVIVGLNRNPIVQQGDALFNVGVIP